MGQNGKGGGGAVGHVHVLGAVVHGEGAVQVVGHLTAHIGQSLGGGIGVERRGGHGVHQTVDGLTDAGGRVDAGTADGEVIHILRPHNGGPLFAVCGDLADGAAAAAPGNKPFRNHTFASLDR